MSTHWTVPVAFVFTSCVCMYIIPPTATRAICAAARCRGVANGRRYVDEVCLGRYKPKVRNNEFTTTYAHNDLTVRQNVFGNAFRYITGTLPSWSVFTMTAM